MGKRKRYRQVIYDYVWSPDGSGDPGNWSDEAIDALVDALIQSDKPKAAPEAIWCHCPAYPASRHLYGELCSPRNTTDSRSSGDRAKEGKS